MNSAQERLSFTKERFENANAKSSYEPNDVQSAESAYKNAQNEVRMLTPQHEEAFKHFETVKKNHGAGHERYVNAETEFFKQTNLKNRYETEALLARAKMSSPEERQAYKASYSGGRI
jgi:ferric-dicitrate binding protein FerR (iron transport regulator)